AYQATAADPDGDPLTFAIVAGPDGLKIDAQTGAMSWSPTAQQVGPHDVSVTVDDGKGGKATQSYTILVQQVQGNHRPVIASSPVTTAVVSQPYRYDVTAVDPDNDPLTYSLTPGAPDGMEINHASGEITWPSPGFGPLSIFSTDFSGGVPP